MDGVSELLDAAPTCRRPDGRARFPARGAPRELIRVRELRALVDPLRDRGFTPRRALPPAARPAPSDQPAGLDQPVGLRREPPLAFWVGAALHADRGLRR